MKEALGMLGILYQKRGIDEDELFEIFKVMLKKDKKYKERCSAVLIIISENHKVLKPSVLASHVKILMKSLDDDSKAVRDIKFLQ